jgi:hypothetical protein
MSTVCSVRDDEVGVPDSASPQQSKSGVARILWWDESARADSESATRVTSLFVRCVSEFNHFSPLIIRGFCHQRCIDCRQGTDRQSSARKINHRLPSGRTERMQLARSYVVDLGSAPTRAVLPLCSKQHILLWDLSMSLSKYLLAWPRICPAFLRAFAVPFARRHFTTLHSGMTFYTGSNSTQLQSRHL